MNLISKYELIEKIVHTNDENLLHQIKNLLDEEVEESWDDLHPDLKDAINKSLGQADRGEVIPHKKAMAEIKKKYLKK
jgi:hypothetical protein